MPVLSKIAAELGLVAYVQNDYAVSQEEARRGKLPSTWLIMARASDDIGPALKNDRWRACGPAPQAELWTDESSNLLRAIRW